MCVCLCMRFFFFRVCSPVCVFRQLGSAALPVVKPALVDGGVLL